jgi:hypothetical protein
MRPLVLATLATLATAAPAAADTFAVDRNDDASVSACTQAADDCTLRGAITASQQTQDADTITIPAFRITLATTLPTVDTSDTTIAGAGARQTIIDGGGHVGEIFSSTHTLALQDLTVTGAADATLFGDGAVNGRVDLERVAIVDNQSSGAAISFGTVSDSLIARNSGVQAGGINALAVLIRNSTITDNTANPAPQQPLAFAGGVVSSNFAVIEHSTIARNHVAPGTSVLLGEQIGAITQTSLSTVISSSVVDGDGRACGGPIQSHGNNVGSDQTCNFDQPGDRAGVDPRLAPLGDNGGATDTIALLEGSPAIDAGADCPATDQRGTSRLQGATCDAGAFESPFTATLPPADPPGGGTATPPPAPVDTTPPRLTIGRLASTTTRRKLRTGLKVRLGADEPIVAELTLLVARSPKTRIPNVEIAARSLAKGAGTRTVTLKAARPIAGKRHVAARLRVVAYDLSGNRSSRTVGFTVR